MCCVLLFYSHEKTVQHTLSETATMVAELKQSFLVKLHCTCTYYIVLHVCNMYHLAWYKKFAGILVDAVYM